MYCNSCGKALANEKAAVCLGCGVAVSRDDSVLTKEWSDKTYTTLMIVAFFIPIIGFIAGIIGMLNGNSKKGLTLLIFSVVMWFVGMVAIGVIFGLSGMKNPAASYGVSD